MTCPTVREYVDFHWHGTKESHKSMHAQILLAGILAGLVDTLNHGNFSCRFKALITAFSASGMWTLEVC